MFKLKQGLLFSLIVFLAACGSQAELPNTIPTDDAAIGQIDAAELEQAFDTETLTTQSYWNKAKFNKFVVEKKVVGYGPEHQKYKVAIVCKVPNKKHVLAVVGAAHLKGGERSYFYAPKKYVECAAIELETFGDEVGFKFEQNWKYQYSGVEYKGQIFLWGKKLDYKGSKFFHVKPGEAKFTVINKYVEKKLEIVLKKEFKLGYNGDVVHPDYYQLKLQLICGGVLVGETTKTHDSIKVSADKVRGKECELKEYFEDDKYKTVQYRVVFDDGVKSQENYNDCNNARQNYCEFSRYNVSPHATKLILVITNNVKELLEVTIKKEFKLGYDYETVNPEHYELALTLICGGKEVAMTSLTHYSTRVYADQVRGMHCELKEKFSDDKYQAVQYNVKYDDGIHPDETYNNCRTEGDYDYCEYSRYDVNEYATKLHLYIRNNVVEKHPYPNPYPS